MMALQKRSEVFEDPSSSKKCKVSENCDDSNNKTSKNSNLIYLISAPNESMKSSSKRLDLNDTELQVLLKNFYRLQSSEQKILLKHLRALENENPELVIHLKNFLRVTSPEAEIFEYDFNVLDELDDILDENVEELTENTKIEDDLEEGEIIDDEEPQKSTLNPLKDQFFPQKSINKTYWKSYKPSNLKNHKNDEENDDLIEKIKILVQKAVKLQNSSIQTKTVTKETRNDVTKTSRNFEQCSQLLQTKIEAIKTLNNIEKIPNINKEAKNKLFLEKLSKISGKIAENYPENSEKTVEDNLGCKTALEYRFRMPTWEDIKEKNFSDFSYTSFNDK